MEVEPRTAEQYKCHYCCVCKNYRGTVIEDGEREKKCFCIDSWLTRRSRMCEGKKLGLGQLIARATSPCLFPDTL